MFDMISNRNGWMEKHDNLYKVGHRVQNECYFHGGNENIYI